MYSRRQLQFIAVFVVALMIIPPVAAIPTVYFSAGPIAVVESSEPNTDIRIGGGYQEDIAFEDIREQYEYLLNTDHNLLVVYDDADDTTTKAAEMFKLFLDVETNALLVPVSNIYELEAALTCVRDDQVIIEVIHGVTESFFMSGEYYDWSILDNTIRQSKSKRHVLASCFSSVLDVDTPELRVKGLETLLDYQVAVPILTLYALEFLYDLDSIDRTTTGLMIQKHIDENQVRITDKILNPTDILGTKKTLYQRSEYLEKLKDLVDVLLLFIKNEIKGLAKKVIGAILGLIPETLFNSQSLLDSGLDMIDNVNLSIIDDLPSTLENKLDGWGKEKKFRVPGGNLGHIVFFFKFHIDKNLDSTTDYHIKSTYLQIGLKWNLSTCYNFSIGVVPLKLNVSFKIFHMNDLLLEYMGHDPNWVSTAEQPINPDMYIVPDGMDPNDPTNATSFLAYANIDGPYGDVPVEAWWGCPLAGVDLPFRSYGGFEIKLTVTLNMDQRYIMEKLGHTPDVIGKAMKKIADFFEEACTFGQTAINGYFTLTGAGIKISILGSLWVGIDIELEHQFGKYLEFALNGFIRIENLLMGEIDWTQEGLWLSQAKVFYPRLDFNLIISLEVTLGFDWLTKTFEFNLCDLLGLSTFYFPTGAKTDDSESFGNILWKGKWNVDNSPISFNVPVNQFFMDMITLLTSRLPGDDIMNALAGTISVIDGTPVDTDPPELFFVTPAYEGDPIAEWPDITQDVDYVDLVCNALDIDLEDAESEDLSRETIDPTNTSLEEDNLPAGAASMEVHRSEIIPLWGDNASIRLYVFDKHTADNTDSYVTKVTVTAEFELVETPINYGLGEYLYSLYDEYTFEPTNQETEMRLFYSLEIYERIVFFYDDDGMLFHWTSTAFYDGVPEYDSGFTPWVNSTYIRVVIHPLTHAGDDNINVDNPDNPDSDLFPYSRLFIMGGEVKFINEWDSNITQHADTYTIFDNGGVFLDEDSVRTSGFGDGPMNTTCGYSAYYDLKLPLHKFYRDGLIKSGWVTFTATAYDTADLRVSKSYTYWVDIPEDTLNPTVTRASANTRDIEEYPEPSPTIAASGIQHYDFDIVDPQQFISYTFDFGAGSSTRGYHTGIPHQFPDQVALYRPNPRAIVTQGDGLLNAYQFEIDRSVSNTDETIISADVLLSGDFSIHVYVTTNTAINEIIYQTSFNNHVDGSEIYINVAHMNLNSGEWNIFLADLQKDIQRFFDNGIVNTVVAFEIRGNAMIDNIQLDFEMLMDADVDWDSGWVISDNAPAGARILVELTDRPELVDADFQVTAISGNTVIDTEMVRISQRFRATLDTRTIPDGYYILQFTGYDFADHCDTEAVWIIIDNHSPTAPQNVQFTPDPNTNPKYGFDYDVTWDPADDGMGVRCYMIKHDGVLRATVSDTRWDGRMLDESYLLGTWEIIAEDWAGRTTAATLIFNTVPDYDEDGIDDISEWETYGTDPLDQDSDSDGMTDGWEVDYGLNPLSNDASGDKDEDGLSNYNEYALGADPTCIDSDYDAMTDGWEYDYGLNPVSSADAGQDADDDGRMNFQEFYDGTNPLDPDSDNDQLSDGLEASIGSDPLCTDSDGDGLSDTLEYYTYGTNPTSTDSDSDNMPDKWEVNNNFDPLFDDALYDADNDGLTNLKEYQKGTLPRDSDTDNDGLKDGAEVNTHGTDPKDADPDNDGLNDYQEVVTYGTNPNDGDSDDDTLSDYTEIHSTNTDPLDSDSDNDNINDGTEVMLGTDPNDRDSDNDGLTDYMEVYKLSTNPLDSDSDNDGYSDYEEFLAGTDPNNRYSYPGSDPPVGPIIPKEPIRTSSPLPPSDGPLPIA
ncbi:MAG: exported protein of unknown function [Candidatus Thorarchaeota archaeon]|nr:MAG: exported protein of unknown function [Candidatus Thorarchaeota archaeon]